MALNTLKKYILTLGFLSPLSFSAHPAPHYFDVTGNYYDMISGSFTWNEAKIDAARKIYNGSTGHLAVITSEEENEFIRTNFQQETEQHVGPWLGAELIATGNGLPLEWLWVTDEPFSYTAWNTGEPSQGGEDALHFSLGGWNNIERERTDTLGYIVEYELDPPTAKPSEISVQDGFVNLDTTQGAIPDDDWCSQESHEGRLIVDNVNSLLYVCTQSGWVAK